jgi:hypothetical protein
MTVSISHELMLDGIGLADDRINLTAEARAYLKTENRRRLSVRLPGVFLGILRMIAMRLG